MWNRKKPFFVENACYLSVFSDVQKLTPAIVSMRYFLFFLQSDCEEVIKFNKFTRAFDFLDDCKTYQKHFQDELHDFCLIFCNFTRLKKNDPAIFCFCFNNFSWVLTEAKVIERSFFTLELCFQLHSRLFWLQFTKIMLRKFKKKHLFKTTLQNKMVFAHEKQNETWMPE